MNVTTSVVNDELAQSYIAQDQTTFGLSYLGSAFDATWAMARRFYSGRGCAGSSLRMRSRVSTNRSALAVENTIGGLIFSTLCRGPSTLTRMPSSLRRLHTYA